MWRIGGNIVGAGRYPNAVRRLVQYVIIDFSSHENREFSFYDQGAGTFFLAMCSALIVMFYEKMKSFFPIISSLHGACLDCFFVNASRVFRNSLPGLCRLSGIQDYEIPISSISNMSVEPAGIPGCENLP